MRLIRKPQTTFVFQHTRTSAKKQWEKIGEVLGAAERKVEDGERVRIDSTAAELNIHHPADSAQWRDGVRVLTRILRNVETAFERLRGRFSDHTRVAKRLRYKINNARHPNKRKPLYKRLIDTASKSQVRPHHHSVQQRRKARKKTLPLHIAAPQAR